MQVRTNRDLSECIRIFRDAIRKRPLKLKVFPFQCEPPQISGTSASIAATFQIAEPYGMVRMQCERRDGVTYVQFVTDGNLRGRITANSMAKNIASRLS
jgi:hypothetical protein